MTVCLESRRPGRWAGSARTFLVTAVIGLLLLSACAPSQPATAPPTPAASGSAGFPLTLEQAGGQLVLERRPERIFVIDNWGLDLLVSLGVKPVGVATFFPPSPWFADAAELKGVPITSVTDAFPAEKIAAARPDLIVDLSGNTITDAAASKQLQRVAPVLYPPKDADTDSWQDRVRHLGRALGVPDRAEQVVGEGDRTVADLKQRYPELAGASLSFARMDPPASFAIVAGDDDFSRRFLDTELGFTTPPKQLAAYREKKADVAGGVIEGVSLEQLDLLDADADAVMIWFQDDQNLAELNKQQIWREVPFVAEGRLVPLDINAAIALRTPTPNALTWASDNLIPRIAAAVEKKKG